VPKTSVVLYREEDGSCPFLDWYGELPVKAQGKYLLRLERLRELIGRLIARSVSRPIQPDTAIPRRFQNERQTKTHD
jgi:hypothetical protein